MRVKDLNKELLIRQKTIELVVKDGFDGLSMHKVAAAAGVSVNTIYLNFKNREDLIVQVYLGVVNEMDEVLLKGFDVDMNYAEGLRLQWKNRVAYCLKYPLEAQFAEQLRSTPLYIKVMELQGRKLSAAMQKFCSNAVQKGQLKELTTEVYWSIAFGPLYQLIKFHQQKKSMSGKKFTLTPDKLNEALEQVILALTP